MFRSGRNRLRIYQSAKEQGVQFEGTRCGSIGVPRNRVFSLKEQAEDLSECQGTGCSGGRNKLRIYQSAKEQGVQFEGTG
jgi:hypothetical protein